MVDLKKVLFCNISWMKKYAGITKDDIPFSGTEYVQVTGDAFEKYNFLEFDDGYQYGFVETKHHENEYKKFNLTNFGEEFKDQNVASGILVVFFARNPKDLKFCIVGYYKNADVLRIREFAHHDSVKEPIQYNFRCKKEDSVFIEVKDRVPLNLPKDIRLFHQQLFIYPSTKEYASICTKIVENIFKYDITKESGYLQYYHQSWIVPLRTNITGDTWLPQTNNDISAGDYIYIYIGAPINAYKYKCIVMTANVAQGEVEGANSPLNMRIKLIGQIHVPLKEVFDNVPNVSIAPQSQRQLSGPYLSLLESALLIDENKKPSLADLDDEVRSEDIYDGEISSTPRPPITRDGVKIFQRNENVRRIALLHSQNRCAIEGCNHELFISRTGRPYLEAHHIIPVNAQESFPDINIDIPENVVCLCPSCHREIHNGENAGELIVKLYNLRKGKLKEKGINISVEELLEFYK